MTAVLRTFTWAALGALFLAWASCGDGDRGMGGFSGPPVPEPTYRFGVVWDSLVVDSGQVKSGQSLSHLLDPAGIGPGKVATLAANSRPTYDVRNMRAGREWWLASLPVRDSLGKQVDLAPMVHLRAQPQGLRRLLAGRHPRGQAGFVPRGHGVRPGCGEHREQFVFGLGERRTPHQPCGVHGQRVRLDHRLQSGATRGHV